MKKTLLFLVGLFVMRVSFAQISPDSIARIQIRIDLDKIGLIGALVDMESLEQVSSDDYQSALREAIMINTYSVKLQRLADSGNAAAQNILGFFYAEEGHGVVPNPELSFYWYNRAAEQGNLTALNGLGYCYENGYGVEKNDFQAFSFYKKAALGGVPNAFGNIAHFYLDGEVVPVDTMVAIAWYKKGAEFGIREAQYNVGYLFLLQREFDDAFYWLSKAAEQGSPGGYYLLGFCYEKGLGTSVDKAKAINCYEKSAELGHEYALEEIHRLQK